MHYEEALENCIFRFVSGSHAYGTSTPESDHDYRGVFIAPLKYAFELFQSSFVGQGSFADQIKGVVGDVKAGDLNAAMERLRQIQELDHNDLKTAVGTVHATEGDEELQELRKFLKLASDSNPNIIEFLYVDDGVTHRTKVWDMIASKRDLFLSKKARYTFSGYAISQLKRIEGHRGYLMDPPKGKPARGDYGLPQETVVPVEMRNALLTMKPEWVNEQFRAIARAEKVFQDDLGKWKAYEKWSSERNPKRKEIEAKWGYDTKHAMHLVRLIRMSKEILSEGVVRVNRRGVDAAELMAIRNGAWPYEKVVEVASQADAELDALYKKSKLRDKPDHKAISELYKEIVQEQYGIKL